MPLQSLTLQNFRNHEHSSFAFKAGITVITGKNGVGKTSILEAVSLLGSTKSFRPAKTVDYTRFGQNFSALKAKVSHNGLESELQFQIMDGRRRIEINHKSIKLLRNLHAILPCVVFSPSDHKIIDGDASDRRFFLNHALGTFDYAYSDALSEFNRALVQRNKLLKLAREQGFALERLSRELNPWDDLLAKNAVVIATKREGYCQLLSEAAAREYKAIAGRGDEFRLVYELFGKDEYPWTWNTPAAEQAEILKAMWKESLRVDTAIGSTSIGPHKDDLRLILNTKDVKFFGSQGEKRTSVLALRLAEVDLLKTKQGLNPVLLVDDVSSELDTERRLSLVELLKKEDQQVLITATELPATLVGALERPYEHIAL